MIGPILMLILGMALIISGSYAAYRGTWYAPIMTFPAGFGIVSVILAIVELMKP